MKCTICGTPYEQGETIDIGIGYQQVSPDIPNCSCEYVEWLEKQTKEAIS